MYNIINVYFLIKDIKDYLKIKNKSCIKVT